MIGGEDDSGYGSGADSVRHDDRLATDSGDEAVKVLTGFEHDCFKRQMSHQTRFFRAAIAPVKNNFFRIGKDISSHLK